MGPDSYLAGHWGWRWGHLFQRILRGGELLGVTPHFFFLLWLLLLLCLWREDLEVDDFCGLDGERGCDLYLPLLSSFHKEFGFPLFNGPWMHTLAWPAGMSHDLEKDARSKHNGIR